MAFGTTELPISPQRSICGSPQEEIRFIPKY